MTRADFIGLNLSLLMLFLLLGVLGCREPYTLGEASVRPAYSYNPETPISDTYSKPAPEVIINKPVNSPWRPKISLNRKNRWKGIVIHHSASRHGSAEEFNRIHKENRGWDGLGYDFVIDNGNGQSDGKVEVGYRWKQQLTGAHCRPKGCTDNYWNEHTIGICLVGNFEKTRPTSKQYDALADLVSFLQNEYGIAMNKIIGHRDVPGAKTLCPGKNFSWWQLRRRLQ